MTLCKFQSEIKSHNHTLSFLHPLLPTISPIILVLSIGAQDIIKAHRESGTSPSSSVKIVMERLETDLKDLIRWLVEDQHFSLVVLSIPTSGFPYSLISSRPIIIKYYFQCLFLFVRWDIDQVQDAHSFSQFKNILILQFSFSSHSTINKSE